MLFQRSYASHNNPFAGFLDFTSANKFIQKRKYFVETENKIQLAHRAEVFI